jgi:hypothetical protein
MRHAPIQARQKLLQHDIVCNKKEYFLVISIAMFAFFSVFGVAFNGWEEEKKLWNHEKFKEDCWWIFYGDFCEVFLNLRILVGFLIFFVFKLMTTLMADLLRILWTDQLFNLLADLRTSLGTR